MLDTTICISILCIFMFSRTYQFTCSIVILSVSLILLGKQSLPDKAAMHNNYNKKTLMHAFTATGCTQPCILKQGAFIMLPYDWRELKLEIRNGVSKFEIEYN